MAIHHHYPEPSVKEKVWVGIFDLIEADRLKTIDIVLTELEDNAEYSDGAHLRLAKADSNKLIVPWHPFVLRAGEIADKFSKLQPANHPKTKADTLIIAIAEDRKSTVVCNESRTSPRKRNMILACKYYNVHCDILADFVKREKFLHI